MFTIHISFYIIAFSAYFILDFIDPEQSIYILNLIVYIGKHFSEPTSTLSIISSVAFTLISIWYIAKNYYSLCKLSNPPLETKTKN